MSTLLRTPLFDWHAAHGGRMVEFGGWEMPVQYSGIVEEHHAVRRAAGLFDISHMGRLTFHGTDAVAAVDQHVTCSVAALKPWQMRYGLLCRDDGGVLDDVIVTRLPGDAVGMVVNASNRVKALEWLRPRLAGRAVELRDHTAATAMLALQGPQSAEILRRRGLQLDLGALKYYRAVETDLLVAPVTISRSGYTGEDGFEIMLPAAAAVRLWEGLLEAGAAAGLKPCGLGARDTLRLEAAMPLYGHELNEQTDPLTAGLAFAVKLDKPDFVGKAALQALAARTDRPVRIGLKLDGRRIAREGAEVYVGAVRVGAVTSGTFSPTLELSIAMAYVDAAHAGVGTRVEVDIRGKREPAAVAALPFYKRAA